MQSVSPDYKQPGPCDRHDRLTSCASFSIAMQASNLCCLSVSSKLLMVALYSLFSDLVRVQGSLFDIELAGLLFKLLSVDNGWIILTSKGTLLTDFKGEN